MLECIYEPLFSKSSHGGRPGRGCDTALIVLNERLMEDVNVAQRWKLIWGNFSLRYRMSSCLKSFG